MPHREHLNRRSLARLLVAQVFFALTAALPTYVTSTFLSRWVDESRVGLVYTSMFAVVLVALCFIRPVSAVAGRRLFSCAFAVEVLGFAGVAIAPDAWTAPVFLIVALAVHLLALLGFDLLVESVSSDRFTGRIRGIFLTALNVGFVVAPWIAGQVVDRFGFGTLYMLAALAGIPALAIVLLDGRLPRARSHRRSVPLVTLLAAMRARPGLLRITGAAFLLFLFYVWMVIYTPLYLLSIGWSWAMIGTAFTFMLIPFVVLQLPAGWVADRWLGEQEMLIVGFMIMAASTFLLPYATSVVAVTVILVASRVGASLVEILADVHFLKHIDLRDLALLDVYRLARPAAYVVGTLLATLILTRFPMSTLFTVLGVALLSGVVLVGGLHDTRAEVELAHRPVAV